VPNVWQQIGRGHDLDTFRFDSAACKFNRRQNQRGLRIANAGEAGQILGSNIEATFVNDFRELARKRHHVHARCAFPQQDGQ